MTRDEITRLLESCASHRRVLYETAFLSGLRANELRSLAVEHLDVSAGGLHLDATWTKFTRSGEALRLYNRFYRRTDKRDGLPTNPLLYVPSHPSRDLGKDLDAARIPRIALGGKVDFHAFRIAYVTLVTESGATVKEMQKLVRHSTP